MINGKNSSTGSKEAVARETIHVAESRTSLMRGRQQKTGTRLRQ